MSSPLKKTFNETAVSEWKVQDSGEYQKNWSSSEVPEKEMWRKKDLKRINRERYNAKEKEDEKEK